MTEVIGNMEDLEGLVKVVGEHHLALRACSLIVDRANGRLEFVTGVVRWATLGGIAPMLIGR